MKSIHIYWLTNKSRSVYPRLIICACCLRNGNLHSVVNSMKKSPMKFKTICLLPSATVVAERLCFHRRLSVHKGGVYNPPRQTAPKMATAADGTHPTGMHCCLDYGDMLIKIDHDFYLFKRNY